METERRRQEDFLARHQDFYTELVKRLSDAVQMDDSAELNLHVQYAGKILETALNYRLQIERMEEGRAGNA